MTRLRLAARAARLMLSKAHADPTADYDAASPDYDTYFSPVMGTHSVAALDEVTVTPGDTVVELACGTGHLTEEIVRRLDGQGTVLAVDKSPGMLKVAQDKVLPLVEQSPGLEVVLEEDDMESFVSRLPSSSADLVVVGWAICYSKPTRLLAQIARVLKPGGQVLVIETRGDAHQALTERLEHLFAEEPSLLTGLIRVSLPKDAATVARWFAKAGLSVTLRREGSQVIPAHTPEEVVEWVQRSGAAAGFKNAIDQDREQEVLRRVTEGLDAHLSRHGSLDLHHTFVVVSGRRPTTTREVSAG